jgi:hypothetical protein
MENAKFQQWEIVVGDHCALAGHSLGIRRPDMYKTQVEIQVTIQALANHILPVRRQHYVTIRFTFIVSLSRSQSYD